MAWYFQILKDVECSFLIRSGWGVSLETLVEDLRGNIGNSPGRSKFCLQHLTCLLDLGNFHSTNLVHLVMIGLPISPESCYRKTIEILYMLIPSYQVVSDDFVNKNQSKLDRGEGRLEASQADLTSVIFQFLLHLSMLVQRCPTMFVPLIYRFLAIRNQWVMWV